MFSFESIVDCLRGGKYPPVSQLKCCEKRLQLRVITFPTATMEYINTARQL